MTISTGFRQLASVPDTLEANDIDVRTVSTTEDDARDQLRVELRLGVPLSAEAHSQSLDGVDRADESVKAVESTTVEGGAPEPDVPCASPASEPAVDVPRDGDEASTDSDEHTSPADEDASTDGEIRGTRDNEEAPTGDDARVETAGDGQHSAKGDPSASAGDVEDGETPT